MTSSDEQSRCVAVLLTLLDGLRTEHGRVLAIAASNRPDAIDPALRRPGRLEWEVPLSLPTAAEREAALRVRCDGMPLDEASLDLTSVAHACSGYAAADLIGLAREAMLSAARRQAASDAAAADAEDTDAAADAAAALRVSQTDFDEALRRSRASVLRPRSSVAPPIEPLPWDMIGGAEQAKRRLKRAIEWPTTRAHEYTQLGIVPPRGVLLHGPPGCAKTSLARAAAGAVGVSFLYLSGASLYSPFVGEAERQLRELFALGRACAPAILFLDELDAIVGTRANVAQGGGSGSGGGGGGGGGAARSGGGGGGEAVQLRVLSTLLNEMDGISPLSQVVMIGATNRVDMLDAALLRPGRFDEIIEIAPPDALGREQVLRVHTKKMPLDADVELAPLAEACEGWSGAQLSSLCREAGMQALRESLRLVPSSSSSSPEGQLELVSVAQRHFEAARSKVHGRTYSVAQP